MLLLRECVIKLAFRVYAILNIYACFFLAVLFDVYTLLVVESVYSLKL